MAQYPRIEQRFFSLLFGILIGLTLVVWILRGLGLLGFIPGLMIWVLLLSTIAMGVLSKVAR
nr:hypothetical protein [Arthrospira sp. PLM2.Bin9]